MRWLVWKEYRLQRLILVVGLLVLVAPYGLPYRALWIASPDVGQLPVAACISTIMSIVILALLGGNAFAGERVDRSAEFQAYQPISRELIVLSKLPLPLLAAALFWGLNLLVFVYSVPDYFRLLNREWLFGFMCFGFCAFAVAWLVSALQSSVTFAVGAGMVAPITILFAVGLIDWLVSDQPNPWQDYVWASTSVVIGMLSFAVGSWYFVRRVEP